MPCATDYACERHHIVGEGTAIIRQADATDYAFHARQWNAPALPFKRSGNDSFQGLAWDGNDLRRSRRNCATELRHLDREFREDFFDLGNLLREVAPEVAHAAVVHPPLL